MAKLKFAILGCGRISYKHLEGIFNNYEKAELVAICDVIPEKMDQLMEKCFQLAEGNEFIKEIAATSEEVILKYTDYKEMLENEDIDVVTIATESGYHATHAIDCMIAGKHVIVEKPMALSTKDADDMIETAKRMNVKLAVCHQNRFNLPIQKLKAALKEGRFGKLVNGTARILWNRNMNYYKQAPWRGTWEQDGGTLMNQCIHNIDLLQWMMGGEVESIFAQTGTFLRDIEAEDFGAIIIRFKNGAIGIVEGSACVYPKNLEETLSIFGENGTVVIGGLAVNKIETWRFADGKDNEEEILKEQGDDPDSVYGFGHTPLFKDFINAISQDTQPLVNGKEGKKALNIILGTYKAQLTNSVVTIDDLDFDTCQMKK